MNFGEYSHNMVSHELESSYKNILRSLYKLAIHVQYFKFQILNDLKFNIAYDFTIVYMFLVFWNRWCALQEKEKRGEGETKYKAA